MTRIRKAKEPTGRIEEIRDLLEHPFRDCTLTPMQMEVARLASYGLGIEKIAGLMGKSPQTIASHLQAVKLRIGAGKLDLTFMLISRLAYLAGLRSDDILRSQIE